MQSTCARSRIFGAVLVLALIAAGCLSLPAQQDPTAQQNPTAQQIIERSLVASEKNWKLAENYTWQELRIFRQLDSGGNVKEQESKTYDVTLIEGKEYERLIREDGEALAPDKARKEQEKLDKEIAKLQAESPRDREKRLKKQEEEKQEREAMFRAIPKAFTFKLLGEEEVEGRAAWLLLATPRAGFKPFNRPTSWLPKMKAKLWIDKTALIWLKAEVETLDTISFGWVLARVGKGSSMQFEQQLINGEVWMPRRTEVNFDARLALFKKMNGSAETLFSEYKRFSSDSKIVSTSLAGDTQE